MKIHYTQYRNHPEATSISKSTGIINFFIIGLGFSFGLIVAGDGGIGVLWGILIIAASIGITVLISKSANEQIEEITDNVSQALKEMGITISKQVRYKTDLGQTIIRIIIDEKTKTLYLIKHDVFIPISFNSFVSCKILYQENVIGVVRKDYSAAQNTYLIRASRARIPNGDKSSIIFEINYLLETVNNTNKSVLCSPTYSNPKNAITFSNQVIDAIRNALEEEYGKHKEKGNSTIAAQNSFNETDGLQKYRELLDEGLITQDEFNEKKKQITG